MTPPRKSTRSPTKRSSQDKRAKVYATLPPQYVMRGLILHYGAVAAAAVAIVTLLSLIPTRAIVDSGPLPVPSRAEGEAVGLKLNTLEKDNEAVHAAGIKALETLQAQQEKVIEVLNQQAAETISNRLRNLQALIDGAKARYELTRDTTDQRTLEALQSQMSDLQDQARRGTVK